MPRPAPPALVPETTDVPIAWVPLATLRPHPRNDGRHPPEELAHLTQSLQEHGVYRNVVLANDGTILAGHGVVQAAQALGHAQILARRMPYGPNDPQALKILVGDNHIARLRMQDDAALVAVLEDLVQHDPLALLGTGFDEEALAVLLATASPVLKDTFHPSMPTEPQLPTECLVQIGCSREALDEFLPVLTTWGALPDVTLHIQR